MRLPASRRCARLTRYAVIAGMLWPGAALAAFPGANGVVVFEDDGVLKTVAASGGTPAAIPGTTGAHRPAVSADGQRIAVDFGAGAMKSFDLAGANVVTLPIGTHPAWSPDGQKIVYQSGADLLIANSDGTGTPQSLTSGTHSDRAPSWSPDGTRIAFVSDRPSGGDFQIWTIKPDGTELKQITAVGDVDTERPSWSPDSSKLVYSVDPGSFVDVFVTSSNVTEPHTDNDIRITTGANGFEFNDEPAWSPDGLRIVFSSTRTGARELWTMATTGAGQAQVTTMGGSAPDWQPLADADGDSLLDSWETNGIDVTGDGIPELDLPAMGADPLHKDIFVEFDYMPRHRFDDAQIDEVVEAFRVAPVTNPDGIQGITLHVDNGATSVMDPATGATWGLLSRQSEIAHADNVGTTDVNGHYVWDAFETLKQANFETIREDVFHYAIGMHLQAPGDTAVGRSRGVAEGGSDFIVSHGKYVDGVDVDFRNAEFKANTFMHELGHNLGLRHGGSDEVNHKPNYLSVMNYGFLGHLSLANGTGVLDYSRFEIPFNELALNETIGFDVEPGTGPASFLTVYRCPDDSKRGAKVVRSQVDWNCDASIDSSPLGTDTNDDNTIGPLTSQIDWHRLKFDGGTVGAKPGATQPDTTSLAEPTQEEVEANALFLRDYAASLAAAPDGSGQTAPGGGGPAPPGGGSTSPADTTAPVLSSYVLAAKAFRPARSGASTATRRRRPPVGTRVRFTLSEPATVTFTVVRSLPGRRAGGRCRRPTRANRRAKRCVRSAVIGSFLHAGAAGANKLRFTGRIAGKALPRGNYRLQAVAEDPARNASAKPKRSFRIVK